jgi:hypothetical protein
MRVYHPTLIRFIECSDDRSQEKNSAFVEYAVNLDSVREQERLGHHIKIQSQASSTRQVGFQEVGSLSALLVLSNNLPWQEGGSLSLCPVMARVLFHSRDTIK